MPLIESILLLLVVSRIAGEIAEHYGQPAMLGEIAAGVILGPSMLNYIQVTPEIRTIAELGVLLLVFHAGLEMDPHKLAKAFQGKGVWVGIMAFLTPLGMGAILGIAFGFDHLRVIFLSLCIAITALPVSVRILMDLGKLRTDVGEKIIAAAVMNDVASLLVLGVVLELQTGDSGWQRVLAVASWSLTKTVLFMAAIIVAARLIRYSSGRIPVSRKLLGLLLLRLKGKEPMFAIVLLFVLGFAAVSDLIGLHFIVGAFFGAMILGHDAVGRANYEAVERIASSITMGFLGPIFFAVIGLEFHMASLTQWPLVVSILAAAFGGKLLGGYWGGRLAGLSQAESWALGCGVNGRGIMELVIANVALFNGFITQDLFSMLVLMGTVTTLVTPFLLGRAFQAIGDTSQTEPQAARTNLNGNIAALLPLHCHTDNPINDPPVAHPDIKSTVQDTALTFPASDLTANDTDPDNDPLEVTAVIAIAETHGTVRLSDGMVTYHPDPGFNGTGSFGYVVSDGQGGSSIGAVNVVVAPRRRRLMRPRWPMKRS
ncbi:MAG TPA: cation:proton antiporter [Nitrospiraceae bacterium]|nr:cation:proton antiporter [Nitrospiraceae bacterium]